MRVVDLFRPSCVAGCGRKARVDSGRRRGLCSTCDQDAAVRARFPLPPLPNSGPAKVCRHCGKRKPARWKRGLCLGCYRDRAVRALYPPVSRYAVRGVRDSHGRRPLPAPTEALPGTPEKVAVLAGRAARRQQLFHPDDGADAGWAGRLDRLLRLVGRGRPRTRPRPP